MKEEKTVGVVEQPVIPALTSGHLKALILFLRKKQQGVMVPTAEGTTVDLRTLEQELFGAELYGDNSEQLKTVRARLYKLVPKLFEGFEKGMSQPARDLSRHSNEKLIKMVKRNEITATAYSDEIYRRTNRGAKFAQPNQAASGAVLPSNAAASTEVTSSKV